MSTQTIQRKTWILLFYLVGFILLIFNSSCSPVKYMQQAIDCKNNGRNPCFVSYIIRPPKDCGGPCEPPIDIKYLSRIRILVEAPSTSLENVEVSIISKTGEIIGVIDKANSKFYSNPRLGNFVSIAFKLNSQDIAVGKYDVQINFNMENIEKTVIANYFEQPQN
ncbi:MAG: hypothetical protein NW226_15465 [Microscillaceae bacterium]|nr:hypothetical protein [Microscillaceae bacterium]